MSSPLRPESLAIHLDVAGGIAGDMFVAAMIDALPSLATPVLADLALATPPGRDAPAFMPGTSGGIRVQRFGLGADPSRTPAHGHGHDRDPSHYRSHGTAYPTLKATIEEAALPASTRFTALALLERIAGAEAHVHGIDPAQVHFHELADWDSLLDIVAAAAIVARLPGARWSASALPLGAGVVKTAHGLLPVPVPATAEILAGYAWRDDGVPGERVTPTGATILRHLVPPERCGSAPGTGRLSAIGLGAGTRELPGMPNVLRALVFEHAAPDMDQIAVIEFEIDDMTGEEVGLACERLRASAGVVDVSLGARTGKKGRPVEAFRLLVQPGAVDAVVGACFRETSTLGLRVREETRRLLARREVATGESDAKVRVKLAERPSGERTGKAEHDDVAGLEGLDARREARNRAERVAKDLR